LNVIDLVFYLSFTFGRVAGFDGVAVGGEDLEELQLHVVLLLAFVVKGWVF